MGRDTGSSLITQAWQIGEHKVLGFGSTARIPQYPDVPTIAETLRGFEAASWYGLAAPAGTPRAIVETRSAETQRIFAEPEFRDRLLAPNMIFSIASSPESFAARIPRRRCQRGQGDPRREPEGGVTPSAIRESKAPAIGALTGAFQPRMPAQVKQDCSSPRPQ